MMNSRQECATCLNSRDQTEDPTQFATPSPAAASGFKLAWCRNGAIAMAMAAMPQGYRLTVSSYRDANLTRNAYAPQNWTTA